MYFGQNYELSRLYTIIIKRSRSNDYSVTSYYYFFYEILINNKKGKNNKFFKLRFLPVGSPLRNPQSKDLSLQN